MSSTKHLFNKLKKINGEAFFTTAHAELLRIATMYLEKEKIAAEEKKRLMMDDPSEKIPTTHEVLDEIWQSAAPVLRSIGAIVGGGFVSSYLNWNDKKIPGDMDVWVPHGIERIVEFPGWVFETSYRTGPSLPLNITSISVFKHPKYNLKIQVMYTTEKNPFNIVNNFDFDVCKGVMSPGLDKNGELIGARATDPAVYAAIMSNKATFLERKWDMTDDGRPNEKCLNRFIKYGAKGYALAVSENSAFTIEEITRLTKEHVARGKTTEEEIARNGSSYNEEFDPLVYKTIEFVIIRNVNYHCMSKAGNLCARYSDNLYIDQPLAFEDKTNVSDYYLCLILGLYRRRVKERMITDEKLIDFVAFKRKKYEEKCRLQEIEALTRFSYLNEVRMEGFVPCAYTGDGSDSGKAPAAKSTSKPAVVRKPATTFKFDPEPATEPAESFQRAGPSHRPSQAEYTPRCSDAPKCPKPVKRVSNTRHATASQRAAIAAAIAATAVLAPQRAAKRMSKAKQVAENTDTDDLPELEGDDDWDVTF